MLINKDYLKFLNPPSNNFNVHLLYNKIKKMSFIKWCCRIFMVLVLTSKAQTLNYYFGNIHAHTGLSDGNKDEATTGVNDPAGSFAFAKQSLNFDFLGISEHNHYSSPNNPGFTLSGWSTLTTQANAANQDGTFLCMAGMEWGVSSTNNGHVLIYNYPQLIGWESGNYQVYNAKVDYDGLWRKINQQPGAFAYLAHPSWSDFTLNGGGSSTSLLNGPYNSSYDSAIVGLPFRSGLAFSTVTNYTDYSNGNYLDYYKRILSRGYHLGIGYDHDNHYLTFGRNNAGRLVFMAPALTRNDFYNAMRNMKFYGSDDWNAKLEFKLGTAMMGDIVTGSVAPTFNIIHNDMDGELADSIIIWSGVSGAGNVLPNKIGWVTNNNTFVFTDNSIVANPGQERFYFLEVRQSDQQLVISSPIWYTYNGPVGLKEEDLNSIAVSLFPNPAKNELSISFTSNQEPTQIRISTIDGKLIKQLKTEDVNLSINTYDWNKGIYIVNIKQGKREVNRKLVVE